MHESQHVSLDEFKQCYANLLANAYEEEVLTIDLQRAITSLEHSTARQSVVSALQAAKQKYAAANGDSTLLQAIAKKIYSQLGPKQGQKLKAQADSVLASDRSVTQTQWLALIKQFVVADVQPQSLLQALQ